MGEHPSVGYPVFEKLHDRSRSSKVDLIDRERQTERVLDFKSLSLQVGDGRDEGVSKSMCKKRMQK
jgi:hypothetical protein